MPKISVIVPVYNTEKYLQKCLDSLINQTLKDIEIIIINDGSTDSSGEIIEAYVDKYLDKIIYIKDEEKRGFPPRNRGIEEATRRIYCFPR